MSVIILDVEGFLNINEKLTDVNFHVSFIKAENFEESKTLSSQVKKYQANVHIY